LADPLLLVAIGACLAFAFWNGFTDAAYSISTIIATRVLPPWKAVTLGAVGNFLGLFFGTAVAVTIGQGLIDTAYLDPVLNPTINPSIFPLLVISALLGGLVFDIITWWFGLPISESHILIGGIVGAGAAAIGTSRVFWGNLVDKVFLPMIWAPILGFVIAFLIAILITRSFRKSSPTKMTKRFARVQLLSSFGASLMHGANDGQKFVGIVTALLIVAGLWTSFDDGRPVWVILACFGLVSFGTFLGGWRIVKTLAVKITNLRPYQGASAEASGTIVLGVTATLGHPVSTTHAFTASIMGVGATKRLSAVRWGVARKIVFAWILTMPLSAVLAFGTYHLLGSFLL
jgi:PiT family inorganic phosphate transporter